LQRINLFVKNFNCKWRSSLVSRNGPISNHCHQMFTVVIVLGLPIASARIGFSGHSRLARIGECRRNASTAGTFRSLHAVGTNVICGLPISGICRFAMITKSIGINPPPVPLFLSTVRRALTGVKVSYLAKPVLAALKTYKLVYSI
jgi:hypothetical protein